RPAFVPWMTRRTALLVRKRVDKHQLFRRDDFAIGELAPHGLSVGGLQTVVITAARPQIHFGRNDFEAFRTPPLLHTLGIGEALPDQIARSIERARYHEIFDHC